MMKWEHHVHAAVIIEGAELVVEVLAVVCIQLVDVAHHFAGAVVARVLGEHDVDVDIVPKWVRDQTGNGGGGQGGNGGDNLEMHFEWLFFCLLYVARGG